MDNKRKVVDFDFLMSAQATGLQREDVPLPEFGEGYVAIVQELSGDARVEYNDYLQTLAVDGNVSASNQLDAMTRLVQLSVINEDGSLVLTPEEAIQLRKKSIPVLNRLASKAMQLSKIGTQARAEAKNTLKNDQT